MSWIAKVFDYAEYFRPQNDTEILAKAKMLSWGAKRSLAMGNFKLAERGVKVFDESFKLSEHHFEGLMEGVRRIDEIRETVALKAAP